jgi:rieske iron-sulfur protein
MTETDQSASVSVDGCGAEFEKILFSRQTRRRLLEIALATGTCAAAFGVGVAAEEQLGSDERPQKADLLVFSE